MEGKLVRLQGFTPYWGIEIGGFTFTMTVRAYYVLMSRHGIHEDSHGSDEAREVIERELLNR